MNNNVHNLSLINTYYYSIVMHTYLKNNIICKQCLTFNAINVECIVIQYIVYIVYYRL